MLKGRICPHRSQVLTWHIWLNQESPWFKRRGRRMTHVTAGLQIRQEGNVQCLSSELAVLPSLKHFHCLKLVRLNSSFW